MAPRAPKKSPNWIACETHHREEWRAASHVERQGFEYYLPEMYDERDKKTLMFPGFVFASMMDGWRVLCSTRGIKRVLLSGATPSIVRDSEIKILRDQEDERGIVRLSPRFSDGESVRVRNSGEEGFRGIVRGIPVKGRYKILFEIFGQKSEVLFDGSLLESAA